MKNAIYLFFAFAVSTASAQQAATGTTSTYSPVVNFTSEQDHQHMMQQLGIKALRPDQVAMKKHPIMLITMKILEKPLGI